jgi:hypothetical protein
MPLGCSLKALASPNMRFPPLAHLKLTLCGDALAWIACVEIAPAFQSCPPAFFWSDPGAAATFVVSVHVAEEDTHVSAATIAASEASVRATDFIFSLQLLNTRTRLEEGQKRGRMISNTKLQLCKTPCKKDITVSVIVGH